MSLAEKLTELRKFYGEQIPAAEQEKMHRATEDLRNSGIMKRALNVGEQIPAFELPNTKGEIISSSKLLAEGNLVVTFYRGVW